MAAALEDHRSDKDSVRDYADNIIKVNVGEPKTAFPVHEKILRQHSEYSEAALKDEWQEGQQKEISLPDQADGHFSRFLEWLYTRRIACKLPDGVARHVNLAKLYVLGERLLATGL
ncbi:hypothetical protein EJ03DRAFT_375711 [Teratosphaeria nubilosa]|uniref:BTB domain-containing protein n=1 Tax=Teratosphaeria nubilosa TaxID=161662 RepID=A0A6G1L6E3_9PEZI|nr:hypothetical protein EJ03DRAFT_375711 [Teratosphaeria nubilosa]